MDKINSIVLVCHYFPPQQNVGVRRVLFWANYFSSIGIKVVVVTTKKRNSGEMYHLLDEKVGVIEFSFWGAEIVTKTTVSEGAGGNVQSKLKTKEYSTFYSTLRYIKQRFVNTNFGQLLDPRLFSVLGFMFVAKFGGLKKFTSVLSGASVVLSTAPPWPVHLVGRALASSLNAKFVVDYRDPFSNHHMFSPRFAFLEEWIDAKICKSADVVFTVSPSWVEYYSKFNEKTFLIRNGYDESLLSKGLFRDSNESDSSHVELSYFGSVEHESRFPYLILDFIERCDLDVQLNFYGACPLVLSYIKQHPKLLNKVFVHGQMEYSAAISKMARSEINFVCEMIGGDRFSSRGLIPTKIYEYIACGRPILALVDPGSDMVQLLRKSGLLMNPSLSINHLQNEIVEFKKNKKNFIADKNFVSGLSRQESAKKALEFMADL